MPQRPGAHRYRFVAEKIRRVAPTAFGPSNGWRAALSPPLGCECRSKRSAYGCRLGADGRRDLPRHGRPSRRAPLRGPGGWTLGAGEHQTIRLSGTLLGRPAVGGGAIRERAGNHGEDAPGAQPSVKVRHHDPDYRQARNDCCA